MPKLPRVTPRKVVRALLRAGFYLHHQSGSHINLRHETNTYLHVVIAYHNKDLAPKTVRSIIAQAGLTVEEFKALL